MGDQTNSTSSSVSTSAPAADVIRILVATDCHLGYKEDDNEIGKDSFVTFEEILIMANEREVDMILLGGDLFHDNNPSQQSMNRCMSLLRKYTLGDKPVYLELLGNSPIVVPEGGAPVNYMDENMNVSIPVFSIHGNHDDPSGVGFCSSMDTLSSAGLINYFGKWTDLNRIEIRPILLKKGSTLLALYGLSHIKDERLCRLFLDGNVQMAIPNETPEAWFNVFVLHQNRVDRGLKRFIPDSYLPGFLDFVIWGHEHDCDIIAEKNLDKGFYVTQPGSSVPTSLSEGETKPKHVGLLEVRNRKFKFFPLKLQTTRPFVFDTIQLKDIPVKSTLREKRSEEIKMFCSAKVEEMIKESKNLLTGHPKQPVLPLIRLRCDYTEETQLFNLVKFGQLFYKRAANPDAEIIKIKKIPQYRGRADLEDAKADVERLKEMNEEAPESFTSCVESIVENYFETTDNKLLVLSVKGMAGGVQRYLEKGDAGAVDAVIQHQRQKTLEAMMKLDVNEANVVELLSQVRDERVAKAQEDEEDLRRIFDTRLSSRGRSFQEEIVSDEEAPHPVRTGQGSRAGASRKDNYVVEDDEIDEDFDEPPPPTRGRGSRGRRSRGSSATTRAPARGRGSRAPRGGREPKPAPVTAPAPSIRNYMFSSTPVPRSTPQRQAALQSQTLMSIGIGDYEDDSD